MATQRPDATGADGQLPRTATTIKKLAEDNDWSILVLENKPDHQQFPKIEKHTTLLMSRNGTEIGAFWHDGRYDGAVVQFPPLKLIQRDLKDLLSTPVEEFGFDKWPPDLKDDPKEKLRWEYEALNYYVSGHPLDHVNMRAYPDVVEAIMVKDDWYTDGRPIQVLGIVEEPTVKRTRRGGYYMCFFGVSDLSGVVQCFGFGKEYEEMAAGALVHVKGVIEERNGERQIKARTVKEVTW